MIKQKENAGKPYFGPDLCLLGPNMGQCFFERSALLDVRHCSNCNPVKNHGKLIILGCKIVFMSFTSNSS